MGGYIGIEAQTFQMEGYFQERRGGIQFYCLQIKYSLLMKRVFPAVSRTIQLKQVERTNDILLDKISRMKFVNFTSLHGKKSAQSLIKARNTPSEQRVPSQIRSRRAKTVMDDRNSEEAGRLKDEEPAAKNNRPTAKFSSSQRQQSNLEVSTAKKKYPYRLNKKDSSDFDPFQRSRTLGQLTKLEQNFNSIKVEIKPSVKCIDRMKTLNVFAKISEQEQKQHAIILWNQVIQIQKSWHLVKFIRFKNHYQIEVMPYSEENTLYTVKIPEQIGMNLLTEYDYDYEQIASSFIKSSHQVVCIGFDLQNGQNKTKNMFKFQRSTMEDSAANKIKQQLNEALAINNAAKPHLDHKKQKSQLRMG